MGSYGLPALGFKPAEINDPLQSMGKVLSLKSLMQQQQMGQIEVQKAQRDEQDRQTIMQAMAAKPSGTLQDILPDVAGKISPQTQFAMQKQAMDMQKQMDEHTTSSLTAAKESHDQLQSVYNNAMNLPDDQLQQNWGQIAQTVNQIPGLKVKLDPEKPMNHAGLEQIGPGLALQQNYLSSELAKREAAEKVRESGAKADEAAANATLTNQKIAAGAGTPVDQRELQDWLAKNPGKGASDYEIAMKKIVPAYNFNLQNQGGAGSGQSGQPSAMAQAVANGQMKWGDVISPRTPQSVKNAFAKEVMSINPSFNSGDFQVQQAVKKSFTSGADEKNLNAINTARYHIKTFNEAAAGLENGSVQALNKLTQAFGTQFGSDKASNFNVVKDALAGELGKAFAGANVAEGDRTRLMEQISKASSPAQLKGFVLMADHLLAGKQQQMQQTYERGLKVQPNFGDQNQPPAAQPQGGGVDPFSQFGGVPHK